MGNILCFEFIESILLNFCVCVFYVKDFYLKIILFFFYVYYYSLCDIYCFCIYVYWKMKFVLYGVFIS